MKILVTALLSDYKLSTNLIGMVNSKKVSEIILVRRKPLRGVAKVRNIHPPWLWTRWKSLYELWRFVTIIRTVYKENIGVIIGIQMVLHGLQAAMAGYLTRTPFILSVIGSDIYVHMQKQWKRPFLKWALKWAGAILVKGSRSRRMLVEAGISSDKIFESQDYQDENRFVPKDMEKQWDLLFVGNLVPVKRVHALIEAVAEVLKHMRNIHLGILGDGLEQAKLEQLVQNLGIMENVEFLGRKNDAENYINASKAVALVSQSEGVPAVAIEAMYCGVPVILTDVGDIGGMFINEKNALLVPPNDKKALVKAIIRMLTDNDLHKRLCKGALKTRECYSKRWSREEQINEWWKVIDVVNQAQR